MAKGAQSKELVTKKILETFDGSFQYDKEIRIPLIEDGNEIQLKCVLTCAKVNVEPNGENAIPGENVFNEINFSQIQDATPTNIEPTQEEKDNIEYLMKVLGL